MFFESIAAIIQEISQLGKECYYGCVIRNIVGDCVRPHEDAFTKMIKDGIVKLNDNIIIMEG